jgi:hypothetical protein
LLYREEVGILGKNAEVKATERGAVSSLSGEKEAGKGEVENSH